MTGFRAPAFCSPCHWGKELLFRAALFLRPTPLHQPTKNRGSHPLPARGNPAPRLDMLPTRQTRKLSSRPCPIASRTLKLPRHRPPGIQPPTLPPVLPCRPYQQPLPSLNATKPLFILLRSEDSSKKQRMNPLNPCGSPSALAASHSIVSESTACVHCFIKFCALCFQKIFFTFSAINSRMNLSKIPSSGGKHHECKKNWCSH